MRVVVTGGAGFIGGQFAREILDNQMLSNRDGSAAEISELVIFDQVEGPKIDDPRVRIEVGEMTDRGALERTLKGADSVFHFASVVSGGAEADFQLGLDVNLDGTRTILDILKAAGNFPKLVFASSLAVYSNGAEPVYDETTPTPMSSYGVQKYCCEVLIGDYARRGYVDGRSMRFPTIAVRPGKANLANSSFISNIIREPVAGRETVCPVPPDTEICLMSPGRLMKAIARYHNLSGDEIGWPRAIMLPAVKVSVAEMLDALEAQAGPEYRSRVSFETDEKILPMVKSWPVDIVARRAEALGIHTDANASEIVADYLSRHPV